MHTEMEKRKKLLKLQTEINDSKKTGTA